MQDLQKQVKDLRASWKKIYKNANASPASWKPYLPFASLVTVDEVIETVTTWLDRSRAPSGFSPGFHVAKAMAAVSLPSLLSTAQNLEAGQYNHFQNFVNGLIDLLSAIHTMAIYAPKNDVETVNADLQVQLAQTLALLGTAQAELSEKAKLLETVTDLAQEIEESHDLITGFKGTAEELVEAISNSKASADEDLAGINELLVTIRGHEQEMARLVDANEDLQQGLIKLTDTAEELQKRSSHQAKIIDSLLPKGASVGLASAFATRGKQLEKTKWIWMGIFVVSLALLTIFGGYLATQHIETILSRVPLAAPLIWLGWFSAIQYGNIVRVQEDYAFKEATSNAFQGYRDHFEHLASVDDENAGTALNLMAAKTIDILAHEPLRIYGKVEQDASPTHSLAGMFRGKKEETPGEAVA